MDFMSEEPFVSDRNALNYRKIVNPYFAPISLSFAVVLLVLKINYTTRLCATTL